jgi:SAM-dependent methyltransferase
MSKATDERYAPRERKADKILTILRDYLGSDLSEKTCLDVGCSTGLISARLAMHFARVIGVELNAGVLKQATANQRPNAFFVLADGEGMPIRDSSVDVVICAQVYEHTANLPRLVSEIWRVLRPGGVCFFSGPNKYLLMEEHYWLPFLSWLPQPLADLYMRLGNRGRTYDIAPKSYWQLRRLWRPFVICDYASRLIRRPEAFGLAAEMRRYSLIGRLPESFLEWLGPFSPNFNWILVKSK